MNKNVKTIAIVGALVIITMVLFIIFGGKKETFTVSFYTDGGTQVESQSVLKGDKAFRPINPIKEGYIFDNWYLGNVIYSFNDEITKDITLSAKWNKNEISDDEPVIAEKFVVTFDSTGGSKVESQIVEKDDKVEKPTDPTRKDYEFVSWQLDGKDFDFKSEITSDITLSAKWKKTTTTINNTGGNNNNQELQPEQVKKYTIKFNTDGGNAISNQIIEKDKTIIKPTNPTKSGYTFEGWYYNNLEYDFSQKVNSNMTLVARWNKNAVITYKIEQTDSYVGQIIIYVLKDNVKVDGLVDIELSNGTVKRNVEIPKDGYMTNSFKVKTISNAREK